MASRREHLLDAAIQVLGGRGVRAVTHRAVDAEAGLGAGSAANYFPSRDALFEAIVERFAERERDNFEEVALTVCPTSPGELGRALASAARDSTTTHRTLTLSRYALLVESANNPGLREQMRDTGARVSAWFTNWVRLIGSSDPDFHVHVIGNYLTGLALHQLAVPDPHFDPTEELVSLLEALVGAGAPAAPTGPAVFLDRSNVRTGGHHGSRGRVEGD
jgi:AcrR family transcriptional regulator